MAALGGRRDQGAAAGEEDVGRRAFEHAAFVVDEDGVVGTGRGSGTLGQVGLHELIALSAADADATMRGSRAAAAVTARARRGG